MTTEAIAGALNSQAAELAVIRSHARPDSNKHSLYERRVLKCYRNGDVFFRRAEGLGDLAPADMLAKVSGNCDVEKQRIAPALQVGCWRGIVLP